MSRKRKTPSPEEYAQTERAFHAKKGQKFTALADVKDVFGNIPIPKGEVVEAVEWAQGPRIWVKREGMSHAAACMIYIKDFEG